MPCLECDDYAPTRLGPPGGPGLKGDKGDKGDTGPSGINSFTTTANPFVMPVGLGTVDVSVVAATWMAAGQCVFVETAGYFKVDAILSPTLVRLQDLDLYGNAAAGLTILSGKKVTPGGYAFIDDTTYTNLDQRVTSLENSPGGNRSFYSPTAPDPSTAKIGDMWFDTDDGNRMYRFDGSAWVDIQRVISLPDFGLGIKPIVKVDVLPATGQVGDFVILTTDKRLYRWDGTQWTAAVDVGQLIGQFTSDQFRALVVDGAVVAQMLAANSVTADAIGSNRVITKSANIAEAIITDAHIANMSAGKITAGDVQSVNIGYAGKIFHPSYSANKFRAVEFATTFADNHAYGSGYSYGFTHCNPVTAYCPGNAGWGSAGSLRICPDSDGFVRVQMQGRIIDRAGNITLYYRKNGGAFAPLASVTSNDGGRSVIDATRVIPAAATDKIEFYVAPCDGSGDMPTAVSSRYELDVTAFNW